MSMTEQLLPIHTLLIAVIILQLLRLAAIWLTDAALNPHKLPTRSMYSLAGGVVVSFLPGGALYDRETGLLAAVLLESTPFFSRPALIDVPAMFCFVLAWYWVLPLLQTPTCRLAITTGCWRCGWSMLLTRRSLRREEGGCSGTHSMSRPARRRCARPSHELVSRCHPFVCALRSP